jgi:Ribbon-helix-helix domain
LGAHFGKVIAVSRKKISTTIYVTPDQNDRLKLLHETTKVPVAVYIREGIDLILAQYAHLLPGQLQLDVSRPRAGSPSQAQATQATNTDDSAADRKP